MKQRSLFWDNYKGILICLVVLGHFIYTCATNTAGSFVNHVFTFIYLFHMPAFVFSSGYFSRSENSRSEKSVVRLILYYLVFNSLMMVYYTIARQELPQLLTPYSSFWYILSLIFWRLSIKYLANVKGIVPISAIAALLVGFWGEFSNFLALSRTVVFFFFFLLGYKFDAESFRKKMEERNTLQKVLCVVFALAVALGLYVVARRYHLTVSMLCGLPYTAAGHVLRRVLIFICALAAILALLLVVPDVRIPILTKLGKNSLLIYLLHRFVTLIFDRVVPITMDLRIYMLLALAASVITLLVLGSDKLGGILTGLFDRAAEAVTDKDSRKGRTLVAVCLIFALAVGTLPVYRPAAELLRPEIDVAKTVEDSVVLAYVGDLVLLKEQVGSAYDEETDSYDFSEMFRYAEPYLSGADYAIGVLEGPLAGEGKGYSTSDYDDGIPFYLNFPDEFADDIKNAGIDLVTTANNHVMDMGIDGALRTLDVLDEAGLQHTGSYRNQAERDHLLMVEVEGLQIAVLSYTQLVNGYSTTQMVEQYPYLTAVMPDEDHPQYQNLLTNIEKDFERAEQSGADLIVVMPHMGTQFSLVTDEFQKKWNALFAKMGADLILGDHTHCPQPLEYIGDTLVVNCPGNFADGYTGYNSDAKALVEIYLDRQTGQVKGAGIVPMYTQEMERGYYRALPIYDVFTNRKLHDEMYSRDLDRMKQVQELVTGTMLGQTVSIRDLQPRYYFIDGRYCPYDTP